jgi:DNA-directed RNA polymerase specialized sigma24 family protein
MPHPLTEDQLRGIYRGTIDRLYGYVSRRCGGDRSLAEDVTQET